MWFEEDRTMNSCDNCKYSNKDITCKHCDNCYVTYAFTGKKYVDWQPIERGKYYDLFIQWHAWFE